MAPAVPEILGSAGPWAVEPHGARRQAPVRHAVCDGLGLSRGSCRKSETFGNSAFFSKNFKSTLETIILEAPASSAHAGCGSVCEAWGAK